MPQVREKESEQEPIGIVISRGSRAEATPRLSAYVWGQVEETVPQGSPEPRAA